MNLLKQTFSNFWEITLGHVVVALVFLGGLLLQWQKTQDAIHENLLVSEHRDTENKNALTAAVTERNLKLAALENRLTQDENTIRSVGELQTQVAVLASQAKNFNDSFNAQMQALRQELRDLASPKRGE